jgi:hypothetical protein
MFIEEHKARSLKRLREGDSTDLYCSVPRIVENIVEEVHRSLDSFSIPTKDADIKLRCRERLHHEEGIKEVTTSLVKRYGEVYQELIEQEARMHVEEDMGYIPKRNDYNDPYFWDKWKAANETIICWI